ncbi:hypothetical protein N431DRAFT_467083 [Stipitochalara longipes BDJ]|nr:hypothetical protein N431DRAFT_467083 [Stipitochalara longipes BDJ]
MPTPLLSIPPELLSKMFSLLLPNELLDLSLCCRFLSGLANSSLKRHNELSQKHKVLYLGYSTEIDGPLSPIIVLDMIMKDPNMAYYPRVLQVLEYSHDKSDDNGDEDRDWNRFEGRAKEEEIVEKWVGFFEFVEKEPSKWATALLETGDDDIALATLISLLPNLKEVVIWLHHRQLPCTFQTVSRIAQTTHQTPEATHSLSRLQSFRLGQRGDTEADNLALVLAFMNLPSVWHIFGWHVKQEGELDPPPLEDRPENEWPTTTIRLQS